MEKTNKRKNATDTSQEKEAKRSTKRVLPIILCSLLGLLVLFGAVAGTIALIGEATSVVSYGGVRVDKGVAAYLASTYKASYTGDKKDAEALEAATEDYIRKIVVAAYVFDRNASLSDSDKEWIERNVAEILDYRAENSVEKFNEMSEPMGFDYSDFKRATELIYKASNAITAVYGVNGSELAYVQSTAQINEYFNTYSYVKVLYIRTEDKFELDSDGNRVLGLDGDYKTVALSDSEKAERAADIAKITELIENANNKTGAAMTPEKFSEYYDKYNDDPTNAKSGYYFRESTSLTETYRSEYGFSNMINTALGMEVGKYAKSTDGTTVCFIYKMTPSVPDYASSDLSRFFGDFYVGAAAYFFLNSVDERADDVRVKKSYRKMDVASLDANHLFKTALKTGPF